MAGGARIRLARFGKRNSPFYNIVVIDRRKGRNAKPIEVLGTYDPVPKKPLYGDGRPAKDIRIDLARARYWLGTGALPSDPMWRLLAMAGLMKPKFRSNVAAAEAAAAEATQAAATVGALVQDTAASKASASTSTSAEVPSTVAAGRTVGQREASKTLEQN